MNCCIIDLGAYPHDGNVNTGVLATQTGVHKAILFFAGIRIVRTFSGVNNEYLVIPAPFNETYKYRLQIEQPDGELLTQDDCEDFKFEIYQNVDLTCVEKVCEEDDYIYL